MNFSTEASGSLSSYATTYANKKSTYNSKLSTFKIKFLIGWRNNYEEIQMC